MITFEQAKQIALARIGPDCGLVETATIEKPYGWYFSYQSKAYLESGRFEDMLVGSGGFVVDKEEGNVFEFGSAYSLEQNFEMYEAGCTYAYCDLTISRIFDLNRTLDFLQRLPLTYVLPEVAYCVTWHIPQRYTRKQLQSMLERLPCVFAKCSFGFGYHVYEVFQEITKSRCCEYQLRAHHPNAGDRRSN